MKLRLGVRDSRVKKGVGHETTSLKIRSLLLIVTTLLCLLTAASYCFAAPTTAAPAKPAASSPAAPSSSASGVTLNITFPSAGDYYVRIHGQPPYHFMDQTATLNLPSKPKTIYVDDAQTGNVAELPFPANGMLVLHATDFSYVRKVIINVTYAGLPVKAALVSLTAANYSKQVDMTPTDQGSVSFEDVPAGKAVLTITYGQNLSDHQDLMISTDHPAGPVTISAALSNKTDTLSAPPATSTTTAPSSNAPQTSPKPSAGPQPLPKPIGANPAGQLINLLVGVVIVGGAVYLLYRWSKSGGMGDYLKKLGIDSHPTAPAGGAGTLNNTPSPPVTDPSLCPFCGQKKDAMGNCACTISGGVTSPAPAMGSQPRLVASGGVYSGNIYPLGGSLVSIGREATNTVVLSNDNTVSRRHASIEHSGGNYVIRDEGSSNGVFVNGVKISGMQPIRSGDEIQIGNTRFRFEA